MNPKASLIIGILCISLSPIFVKLAGAQPITAAFYRVLIAWLCLAPYCIINKKIKIGRKELIIAIAGGVTFGLDIAVWNLSLVRISATVSTLIANLAPLWVGLLSLLIFKKKSGSLFWIGTFVAIFGMIILVGYQSILHLEFNAGIILALAASFFYAVYIVITKGILQTLGTLTFMFYSMLSASLFLLLICVFQQNNMVNFPASAWLCFLGMGLICQLLGWLTINHSLRFLESTKVSIALLGQTVVAGFLAILLLNEKLEFKEIIGSVIVLGGIAITFLKSKIQVIKT